MKYYEDKKNNIFANPINLDDLTEITNPIRNDGTLLPKHSSLNTLIKDENGNLYKFYNQDGTPDITKITNDTTEKLIVNFKSLYLDVVNAKLEELDYDSLATVKLWENDSTFGAEATRILNWYKAIIAKNYELLNAGTVLTDEEYLIEINSIIF